MKADFHVHTCFSDGKHTPEEVVRHALLLGMTHIGFSDHSYTWFETSCCAYPARVAEGAAEIARLKEACRGRLEVYCGLEQDYDSDPPPLRFDYLIGSVHSLCVRGEWHSVDWKMTEIERLRELMGGDIYAVAEAYYEKVGQVAVKTGCDLIGHFDLITKLNERHRFLDERHPRYVAAWRKAADALLKTGLPFEINTGAMSRGYRTQPYPSAEIIRYLSEGGARFVLSSDSHDRSTLRWAFDRVKPWAEALGACVIDWVPETRRSE